MVKASVHLPQPTINMWRVLHAKVLLKKKYMEMTDKISKIGTRWYVANTSPLAGCLII